MDASVFTIYDEGTDKDFDVMAYGSAGHPVIALPDWDFTCTSWENGGMIDAVCALVDAGRIRIFSADSLDISGWYGRGIDAAYRRENIDANLAFIEQGLVPFVREHVGADVAPVLVGTGVGALNATLLMLRHPERYAGLLALSGTYDARALVDAFDDEWACLSPTDLVAALPPRGRQLRLLRERPCAFVCGQHESERGVESQRALDTLLAECKVPATFEYWGYDVSRDAVWWCEELRQMLPCLIEPGGLAERAFARRASHAQAELDHAREAQAQAKAALDELRGQLSAATDEAGAADERLEQERKVVAAAAGEAERLAADARDVWAERERVAQLLAEAQAAGDEAQAKADDAASRLSEAEWIRGEAEAAAHAAHEDEAMLVTQVDEAEAALVRADEVARRAADELAAVEAAIESERQAAAAKTKAKRQTRAAAQRRVSSAKRAGATQATSPAEAGKVAKPAAAARKASHKAASSSS